MSCYIIIKDMIILHYATNKIYSWWLFVLLDFFEDISIDGIDIKTNSQTSKFSMITDNVHQVLAPNSFVQSKNTIIITGEIGLFFNVDPVLGIYK